MSHRSSDEAGSPTPGTVAHDDTAPLALLIAASLAACMNAVEDDAGAAMGSWARSTAPRRRA